MNQYIDTYAIFDQESLTLIPIWDERIIFHETHDPDYIPNYVTLKNPDPTKSAQQYYDLRPCLYDLKTKALKPAIEIVTYIKEKYPLKVGDTVLVAAKGKFNTFEKTKITKIDKKGSASTTIILGKDLSEAECTYYKIKDPRINDIYIFKSWSCAYTLENGYKTKYRGELYVI